MADKPRGGYRLSEDSLSKAFTSGRHFEARRMEAFLQRELQETDQRSEAEKQKSA